MTTSILKQEIEKQNEKLEHHGVQQYSKLDFMVLGYLDPINIIPNSENTKANWGDLTVTSTKTKSLQFTRPRCVKCCLCIQQIGPCIETVHAVFFCLARCIGHVTLKKKKFLLQKSIFIG